MVRAIAAVLAMGGLAARAAVGYGPVDCGDAPPCGCEPIVNCDPCAVAESAPPKSPDDLPPPPQSSESPARAADRDAQPTPAPANEFPSPPNANTPAVSPPAEDEPGTDGPVTPAAPPTAEAPPATEPPATQDVAPADDASRYGTPPKDSPTTPATDPYEGLFPPGESAADVEPATDTPAADPPAAEETPATDEPTPAEEAPPTPDYDELFPPSSDTGSLRTPGGWASEAPRSWKDADGRVLAVGRVVDVTALQVVLAADDGAEHAFPYAALSNADLRFLREQVEARRTALTAAADRDRLLAGQQ